MPKKVQKKSSKTPEVKKRPVAREEVLKDEDEDTLAAIKPLNDDAISPDSLEAALDTEDSYEADMDAEKDWE